MSTYAPKLLLLSRTRNTLKEQEDIVQVYFKTDSYGSTTTTTTTTNDRFKISTLKLTIYYSNHRETNHTQLIKITRKLCNKYYSGILKYCYLKFSGNSCCQHDNSLPVNRTMVSNYRCGDISFQSSVKPWLQNMKSIVQSVQSYHSATLRWPREWPPRSPPIYPFVLGDILRLFRIFHDPSHASGKIHGHAWPHRFLRT